MIVQWLKHAFAVEPPGPVQPQERQRVLVERVCREIVRRELTTPTLLFLESVRPLNFVGAQALHFFAPFLSALTDNDAHRQFAAFLEQRGSIDYLIGRLEAWDSNPEENDRIRAAQPDSHSPDSH